MSIAKDNFRASQKIFRKLHQMQHNATAHKLKAHFSSQDIIIHNRVPYVKTLLKASLIM